MKNLQSIVLVILSVCVLALFYLQLSGGRVAGNAGSKAVSNEEGGAASLKIAYVDLDSIQANYIFYKQKMNEFEKRKETADQQLNSSYNKIESERAAFAQRGNSITQVEYEAFQRDYAQKMQNLENQKRVMEGQIQEEGFKTMQDLRKRINAFLEEYNKKAGYAYIFSFSSELNVLFYKDTSYNITNEVVNGLNEAYKAAGNK